MEAAVASIDAASPAPSKRRRDADTGLRLQRPPQAPSHRGCGAFSDASHLEAEPPPEETMGTGHCDEERTRQTLEELQQSRLATAATRKDLQRHRSAGAALEIDAFGCPWPHGGFVTRKSFTAFRLRSIN